MNTPIKQISLSQISTPSHLQSIINKQRQYEIDDQQFMSRLQMIYNDKQKLNKLCNKYPQCCLKILNEQKMYYLLRESKNLNTILIKQISSFLQQIIYNQYQPIKSWNNKIPSGVFYDLYSKLNQIYQIFSIYKNKNSQIKELINKNNNDLIHKNKLLIKKLDQYQIKEKKINKQKINFINQIINLKDKIQIINKQKLRYDRQILQIKRLFNDELQRRQIRYRQQIKNIRNDRNLRYKILQYENDLQFSINELKNLILKLNIQNKLLKQQRQLLINKLNNIYLKFQKFTYYFQQNNQQQKLQRLQIQKEVENVDINRVDTSKQLIINLHEKLNKLQQQLDDKRYKVEQLNNEIMELKKLKQQQIIGWNRSQGSNEGRRQKKYKRSGLDENKILQLQQLRLKDKKLIDQLNDQISRLNQRIRYQQKDKQDEIIKYNKKIQDMNDQKSVRQRIQNERINQLLDNYQKDKLYISDLQLKLKDERIRYEQMNRQLNRQLRDKQMKIQQLQFNIKQIKKKLMQQQQQNESLKFKVQQLNGEINLLKSKQQQVQYDIQNLQSKIKSQIKIIQGYKKQIQNMKNNQNIMNNNEMIRLQELLQKRQKQIQIYKNEIKMIRQKHEIQKQSQRYTYQKQLRNKQQQNKQLKIQNNNINNNKIQIEQKYNILQNKYRSILISIDFNKINSNIKTSLFNGDILYDRPFQKLFLIELLQNRIKQKIRRTRLLYKYDILNKINFHKYIDDHQYLVVLIELQNDYIIGGYYQGKLYPKMISNKDGIIFSLTNREIFQPYEKNKKVVTYDDYYIIFGNSQIRVRSQQDKLFSNFAISNSYFNPRGKRVDIITNTNLRQVIFKTMQIYQLQLF